MKKIFSFFSQHSSSTLVLAVIWTILIFIGCTLPGKSLPSVNVFNHFDKVVHITFFYIFFILWNLPFASSTKKTFILMGVSVTYGFGIEFYQLFFVEGRSFDVWDGLADSTGAALGWLSVKLYR